MGLISHDGGQRLGHRLIRYMDERWSAAERWHGAIARLARAAASGLGDGGPGGDPERARRRPRAAPEAPLTDWDDLGHYPQIEDPARVAALLQKASAAA